MSLDVYRARLAALESQDFYQTTRIVDRNGVLLAELAEHGYRTWVDLERVPEILRKAVVATEDRTFYANPGVDTRRVARAAVQNALAGETVSGASTITMQLVRIVAFDTEERFERSLDRKVREAHLAAEIDEQYTKDEILEAYLNVAFFGRHAYGVEAAARSYFGRSASALTPSQSTLLAGLLQAPAALDPRSNLAGARDRQLIVIESLVRTGDIDRDEADLIWASPLVLTDPPPTPDRRARHFVDYVVQSLPEVVGPHLAARGGFTVTTTLDVEFNDRVTALAREHMARLRPEQRVGDAAVVVVRPGSGDILAMVGGLDYDAPGSGQVNVAVSPRQVGSAFKPITYAAALEAGWSPARVLWDIPLRFDAGDGTEYRPNNYDGTYNGPVRMRTALANSLNAASVQLLADVGVEPVHRLATDLGLSLLDDPWQYGLSLTLGGAEVSLLELTGAFAAFADEGRFAPPTPVLTVLRLSDGASIYEREPAVRPVVSPATAWLMWDMLSDVAARQPAFAPDGPLTTSRPTAVKTGTTNDFRDNLTVGYSPYLAVGVWAGNKDGSPMQDVYGITGAAPLWHDVMEGVFSDDAQRVMLGDGRLPPDEPRPPGGIVHATVCRLDTALRGGGCDRVDEVFGPGVLVDDVGTNLQLIRLQRSPGPSGAFGQACAVVAGQGAGSLYFLPPENARVADQVRAWALTQGVPVAPEPCAGQALRPAGTAGGGATG